MKGFYPLSDLMVKEPLPTLPLCGKCKLYTSCRSPKMSVAGKGKKNILVVGEAPGREEDLANRPFVGRSGRLLQDTLNKFGIDLFRDCWVTNSLICHPKGNKITNKKMVDWCRPNVVKTIKELDPEIIVLLGGIAVDSVIGWLWKEDPGGMVRWAGWQIPCQKPNAWLCPVYHPSYVLRSEEEGVSKKQNEVRLIVFQKHLEAAFSLHGRPWDGPQDYKGRVTCLTDTEAVESIMGALVAKGNPVAFDYETDRLKPDREDSQILCCAVSDGDRAWAFPWHGKAIKSMQRFLKSSCPKVGAQIKFEWRWTKRHLGVWPMETEDDWDTVLAAHTLDNRKGVTGLKFQAFVLLGAESYDDATKPYMKSSGSNNPNTLKKNVSLSKLLTYCGVDALLTAKVAKIQKERIGT